MRMYLNTFLVFLISSAYLQTALTKRIAIDSKEARSFAGKGVGKFHKRSPGWIGEMWSGEHDLNEECYVETEGCVMEEVMEAYAEFEGQESQAHEYYREYECTNIPALCSAETSGSSKRGVNMMDGLY